MRPEGGAQCASQSSIGIVLRASKSNTFSLWNLFRFVCHLFISIQICLDVCEFLHSEERRPNAALPLLSLLFTYVSTQSFVVILLPK